MQGRIWCINWWNLFVIPPDGSWWISKRKDVCQQAIVQWWRFWSGRRSHLHRLSVMWFTFRSGKWVRKVASFCIISLKTVLILVFEHCLSSIAFRSVVDQNSVPLYCPKSTNRLHSVGMIYRPFKVWTILSLSSCCRLYLTFDISWMTINQNYH